MLTKIYLGNAFEIFHGEFQFSSIDFYFVLSTEIKLFIYIDKTLFRYTLYTLYITGSYIHSG